MSKQKSTFKVDLKMKLNVLTSYHRSLIKVTCLFKFCVFNTKIWMYFKNKQEGKNTGQGLNCTEPKLHEGTKIHGDNFAQNN